MVEKMKRQLICSNRECSPLFPFTGTVLVKTWSDDKLFDREGNLLETTMYCPVCKGHYVFEANEEIPEICPKAKYGCTGKLQQAKTWQMVCPNCIKNG